MTSISKTLPSLTSAARWVAGRITERAGDFLQAKKDAGDLRKWKGAARVASEMNAFLAWPQERQEAFFRVATAVSNGDEAGEIFLKTVESKWPGLLGETFPGWSPNDWGRKRVASLGIAEDHIRESGRTGGATPLMMAAQNGHAGCVEFLATVASVTAQNSWGATALILALKHPEARNDERLWRALLPGSDVNAATLTEGETALMAAVANENESAVKALLADARCDARKKNLQGQTALELAVYRGPVSTVMALARKTTAKEIGEVCERVAKQLEESGGWPSALGSKVACFSRLDALGLLASERVQESLAQRAGAAIVEKLPTLSAVLAARREASEIRLEIEKARANAHPAAIEDSGDDSRARVIAGGKKLLDGAVLGAREPSVSNGSQKTARRSARI